MKIYGKNPPCAFHLIFSVGMGKIAPAAALLALFAWQAAAVETGHADSAFIDLSTIPELRINLRYASVNNFLGENLYADFNRALLHKLAAEKLKRAAGLLRERKPRWHLVVYDALRPRSVQQRLWDKVKKTDKREYVSNPKKGSMHNYGFAVDLSLLDEKGGEVDMGTAFDAYDSLSRPELEERFYAEGRLTTGQHANRRLLREVMQGAGFIQLNIEWWHFDALPKAEVKARFSIVESMDDSCIRSGRRPSSQPR